MKEPSQPTRSFPAYPGHELYRIAGRILYPVMELQPSSILVRPLLRLLSLFALTLSLCNAYARAQVVVLNQGVPGQSSAELRAHFDSMLQTAHADTVIFFIGMNDAANPRKLAPAPQTAANVEAMVRQVQAAHAKALLVLVHHVDSARVLARHSLSAYAGLAPNARVDAMDSALLELASRDGIPTVDFRSVLDRAGGPTPALSTDGVHLTTQGYALLAQAVRGALPRTLPSQTRILCAGDSLTYGIGVRPAGAPETSPTGVPYPTYPAQLQSMLRALPSAAAR